MIRAAAAHPAEVLQARIDDCLAKIAAGDMYTSVSTGDGASYARAQRVPVEDALSLWQQALEYRQGAETGGAGCYPVIVH